MGREAWNEAPDWYGDCQVESWTEARAKLSHAVNAGASSTVGPIQDGAHSLEDIAADLQLKASSQGPGLHELLTTRDKPCTVIALAFRDPLTTMRST